SSLRDLPSFPTRRSSDLVRIRVCQAWHKSTEVSEGKSIGLRIRIIQLIRREGHITSLVPGGKQFSECQESAVLKGCERFVENKRSEEHTSELQSRENLVC